MTRFLAQYIPDEATLTAPLRTLLRKDIEWQWHSAAGGAGQAEGCRIKCTTAQILQPKGRNRNSG
ncbi:hypothetical protein LDENG_00172000 [Lucifuga dentata]|nr:hypothetical protein LDENG_00172000 [Lucifuga dentata]